MKAKKKPAKRFGTVDLDPGTFASKNAKERVTCMLDEEVVDWLRAEGAKRGIGYQTFLNLRLRQAMAEQDLEKRVEALEQKIKRIG